MYIAGRGRTASRPSRTFILSAPYSATSSAVARPALFPPACAGPRLTPSACTSGVRGSSPGCSVRSVCSIRFGSVPSDAHRHNHVRVVVALGAHRLHHSLADLVLEVERHDVARHGREKI